MVAHNHRVAGAVTRTRLPQNAACGFPALRSSEIASQRGDSWQLRIPEIQLWSQQRGPLLDPMKGLQPDLAFPASAAQHSAPETLYGPMDPLQCPDVSGNAVVRIVTAKHVIELVGLILDRLVPHPPHLVLQMHQRTPQSCLLRTQPHSKVALLIAVAVQGEAQKINRLRASPATLARVSLRIATKFDEFGLRLCQGQAKLPQSLAQYLLDTKSIRAIFEAQHEVVDVSHQVGLTPQPRFDHPLKPQIEHIVQIQITQQDADRTTLWGPFFAWMELLIFQNVGFQPAPDQADQTLVPYSMLDEAEHPFMTQAPKEVLQVRLQNPFHLSPGNHLMQCCQCLMGTPPRPSTKRAWQKVLLVYGGEYLSDASLERPVRYTRHAQRAFLLLSGFRDIHSPNVGRLISLAVNRLKHRFNPLPKALLRLRHRLSIHPGSRACPNLTEILPNPLLGKVMGQGRKPKLWLTPSFRCYSFESCCHGWRFFSLHRRPNPPLVWSPCFRRTTHLPLAASPCSRLSRPPSTVSQSDFCQIIRSPLPCRLVGPYKLRLNLTALPCSHEVLWLHAGGTNPGSISGHSLYRIQRFCLPRRGIGSATSITIDFGAIFPFTDVPAYNLPVYASQCRTSHHARLGTRLPAKLCHGHHFRQLNFMSFQGATPHRPVLARLTHTVPTSYG